MPDPMTDESVSVTPVLHEGGRFRRWSNIDLSAQCLSQAREQLDPEFSQFMTAVAERLASTAATTPARDASAVESQSQAAVSIPPGMVAWPGGDNAPADWNGDTVLLAGGQVAGLYGRRGWAAWVSQGGERIIAYTPKPERVAGEGAGKCAALPDHADIMDTIQNAADDWQAKGYTSALAEVRDMANVGRSLMEALPDGYSYNDSPAEIVTDLINERDDALALSTPAPASAAEQPATVGEGMVITGQIGPCQHQWSYMPTTGAVSCSRCNAFRAYDMPEAGTTRKAYEAALTAAPDHPRPAVGEIERLREALNSAVGVLTMIRRGVSSQAYDLTGCIERGQSALSTTAPVDQHTGEG